MHAVIAFALSLAAGSADAQVRVQGRVVQPSGGSASGLTVLLHRVTAGGGELLAEATTGPDGAFVLASDAAVSPDAVYFVASRVEGRLYIGPMLRPPLPEGEYVLEAGAGATPFEAAMPEQQTPATLPGAATGTSRRWLLLLAPLLGILGLAGWGVSRGTGPAADRRILIQIARLDNAWVDAPADPEDYQRRRRRLLDQLDAV